MTIYATSGDVITLYGIGFGPVSPSVAAGVIATQSTSLVNPVTLLFGQTPTTILYGGLAPGFVGLYQFNVVVSAVGPGDWQVTVQPGGAPANQTLYVATTQ